MINVLLADDHGIFRLILRQILEKASDIQVVAIVENGQQAVEEAVLHRPHVAVMDLSMPIMNGLEAAKQIRSLCPDTQVLMVSTYDTPPHIRRSLDAGALGYILKDVVSKELVPAIRSVHQGTRYFCKQIADLARLYVAQQIIP